MTKASNQHFQLLQAVAELRNFIQSLSCPACGGTGYVYSEPCAICDEKEKALKDTEDLI